MARGIQPSAAQLAEERRITELAATAELVTWDRYERELLTYLERQITNPTEAIALISRYDAAMPREALRHYIVEPARLYAGARAYNGCACGRVWERFGGPDEHAARLHVRLMSLPNILSGECDCGGNRDAIPVFEGRCTGCGAVLHGSALTNRKGAA